MVDRTTIRIRTVDEEEHVFTVLGPSGNGSEYTIGSKIEKLLNQRSIAMALEDRLVIFPMHQVKLIEVSPLQDKLPEKLIPSVRLVHSTLLCGIPA